MYKVVFLDRAINNLQEISSYISLDNPLQAKKVLHIFAPINTTVHPTCVVIKSKKTCTLRNN